MPLGYFANLTAAKLYFTDERLETSAWDELNDIYQTKAITNAYNRLYYSAFPLPAYVEATAAELVYLSKANAEMAYYMCQHLADEDRRKGLQAQGVTTAGIVKEVYDKSKLNEVPIPPFVVAILEEAGFESSTGFGMVDIDRDEDESVDTKIDEF